MSFRWGADEDSQSNASVSRAEYDAVVDRVMETVKPLILARAALEARGVMLDQQEAMILAQQAQKRPALITYSFRRGF